MEEAVPLPSERKFGLFFAAVLGGFAAWSLYRGRPLLGAALLAIALGLIVATLLAPHWLRAPNRAWFKLGMALNAIVSPIVLGAIFVLIFVPVALAMRLAGRDPLHRRYDADASTYWVERRPPGPAADSFNHQF